MAAARPTKGPAKFPRHPDVRSCSCLTLFPIPQFREGDAKKPGSPLLSQETLTSLCSGAAFTGSVNREHEVRAVRPRGALVTDRVEVLPLSSHPGAAIPQVSRGRPGMSLGQCAWSGLAERMHRWKGPSSQSLGGLPPQPATAEAAGWLESSVKKTRAKTSNP